MIFCIRCFLRSTQVRWVSTKIKIVPELNTNVHEDISNSQMNPKKHPGVMKIAPPEVPENLFKAIKFVLRDKPVKTLINDGEAFSRYLEGRHPPMDDDAMKEHVNRIKKTTGKYYGLDLENMSDEDIKVNKKHVHNKIIELYKKYTYNWKPVHYDGYSSLVYLVARTAPEFAVMCKVFNEINIRDKNFQPKSLFDFGSGVGVVSWAAKRFWNSSLSEFFCVDSSSHMNDLSQALMQEGNLKSDSPKGVYFRQFLPSQVRLFDLVVTAHTLFELPNKQARLEILLNLWQKTNHYLIVVERGTNSGFMLINEVRDFILFSNKSKSGAAHVFAPCPHELDCPRLKQDDANDKKTPCNFEVNYFKLPLLDRIKIGTERFSYIVLKKGSRNADDQQWPRIVRPVIKRSGHCVCRLCTSRGKLQEVVFSATKHGKIQYRCARSSKWGDILPVKLNEKEVIIDDASPSTDCSNQIDEKEVVFDDTRPINVDDSNKNVEEEYDDSNNKNR